jgi:hypothetical protein
MKTKTAAIKHARSTVSPLFRVGENYKYRVFDERCNAWKETHGSPYFAALNRRAYSLLWAASEFLHGEDFDSSEAGCPNYNGGRWTDYVEAAK